MTILWETDEWLVRSLSGAVGDAHVVADLVAVQRLLADDPSCGLVVIGPSVEVKAALDLAAEARMSNPALGVVLVRRRIDTALLKEALRAGVREAVTVDDLTGLTEACRQSRQLTAHMRGEENAPAPSQQSLGRIVTVFSAKGGCGKTFLATNLAVQLAKTQRVCLVDLDLAFGDVAISMQTHPTKTIADAHAMSGALDHKAVQSLVVGYSPNLDLMLAPVEPGLAEQITTQTVTDLLRALKQSYDIVVVDSPPAFNDCMLATFDETDLFVLIATLDIPAVKNLKLTLEMLGMLGYSRERIRVVLNRADAKVGLTVADVEKALGQPTSALVPSSRAVPASVNCGRPLSLEKPGHAVSNAVAKLAGTVVTAMAPPAAEDATSGRHRAAFGRLRRHAEAVTT